MRVGLRLVVAAMVVAIIACDADRSVAPKGPDDGTFVLTQITQAGVCSPVALPLPAVADTTLYVLFATVPETATVQMNSGNQGTQVTLTPSNLPGPPRSTLALTGTTTANEAMMLAPATIIENEAPRQGSHLFSVSRGATATIDYQPGSGADLRATATGTATYVFYDQAAAGAPFTTCTVQFSLSGTRAGL